MVGVVYVNMRVSRHLKTELAWAIDKQFQVTSNKMLFIKNQVVKKIKIVVKSDVKNWAYISLR